METQTVFLAATNLIADVRRRYPGEELRCEYMRALDEALEKATETDTAIREALAECASRCRYDGDLHDNRGDVTRRDASWLAMEMAEAALARVTGRLEPAKADVGLAQLVGVTIPSRPATYVQRLEAALKFYATATAADFDNGFKATAVLETKCD